MKAIIVGFAALAFSCAALGATTRHGMDRLPSDFVDRSPLPGQGIAVNGEGDGPFATQWGTWAGQGTHPFGGVTNYPDPGFPAFSVTVSSGAMPIPPGKKFAGFILLDFSAFGPGDFPNHWVDIGPLKQPGGLNVINSVTVIGTGTATTDGSSIFWHGLGANLAGNPLVRIEWTQFLIPSPGAAALLGMGGLVAIRRRR